MTKKNFPERLFRQLFRTNCPLSFCQKLEKTNEAILHKVQKPIFRQFLAQICPKKFFLKIGLHYFLDIAIMHLCAKNQQKIMSQSREKQEIGKWSKGISPKTKIRNLRRKKIFRENFSAIF